MKYLLITGGSGYVGTAFIRAYGAKYKIRLLGRTPVQGLEFVQGDITNLEDVVRASMGVDTILHLAAATTDGAGISDRDYFEKNTVGAFNVLEAAVRCKVKKVVYGSSVCAVGFRATSKLIMETDRCEPSDGMYGYSKYLSERLCECYAQNHPMDIICLRTAMVVPQHEFAVPADPFAAYWLGVVHIDDVVEALRLSIENETIHYDVFHVAAHSRYSKFDTTKARNILGYNPKHDFSERIPSAGSRTANGVMVKAKALFSSLTKRAKR